MLGIGFGEQSAFHLHHPKPDPLSDDFGHISFVAAFIIVAAASNTAFDKDLPALGQVLPARFTLLSPDDNIVPFGSLLPIALRVRPHFRCRNGKARTARPVEVKRTSGSFPKLPIKIALFTDIRASRCHKSSFDGNSKITLSPL